MIREIKIITIKNIEHNSKIKQFTEYSYSKYSLHYNPERVEFLEKLKATGKPVITHKLFSGLKIYFHNCSGYDDLKGEDIVIVGTPFPNPEIVIHYANLIAGNNFKIEEHPLNNRKVSYNGYEFTFMTYENEILRNIQFGLIEEQINQAVGRSRYLRYDVEVEIYSNFPSRLATEFVYEKENIEVENEEMIYLLTA